MSVCALREQAWKFHLPLILARTSPNCRRVWAFRRVVGMELRLWYANRSHLCVAYARVCKNICMPKCALSGLSRACFCAWRCSA